VSWLLSGVLRTGCDTLDKEMKLYTPFYVTGNDQQQEYQQQQWQDQFSLLLTDESQSILRCKTEYIYILYISLKRSMTQAVHLKTQKNRAKCKVSWCFL